MGSRVAEMLQDDYNVRLIEENEARAEHLHHTLEKTECLHGDGSDREILLEAGLLHMDTIVTATDDNETNIMTSVLAKHLLQTRADEALARQVRTIALVRREAYLVLASTLGIDVALHKEVLAANHILRYIRRGHVLSVAHLHGCDAEVIELIADPGSPITRKPLRDLGAQLSGRIIIGAVGREGQWRVAIGITQIQSGDTVICVCNSHDLGHLQALFLA